MSKYVIGVDFGTLSGRTVVVEVATGRQVAESVSQYRHGVMDRQLPSGKELPPDWALQDPQDYLIVLEETIPQALREAGIMAEDVIGIGTDFTSCTVLATDKDGVPLCFYPEWRDNPHSWVKLWKHHAAQPEADKITSIAKERGESFLNSYGGKISSEWFWPKVWQVLNEAPEIFEKAEKFIEAADWIVWQLTGSEIRSAAVAGYKALKQQRFPSQDFFCALDPRLQKVSEEIEKLKFLPPGAKAGGLSPLWAEKLGLKPGIAVAVGNIDAHAGVPGTGVASPGKLVMIMGTSTCHLLIAQEKVEVPGICGVVEDGIIPGFWGYEAGQAAVGDIFAWFVDNCLPEAYAQEAQACCLSPHELLTEKAQHLAPGKGGLLALDWWNGNRSVLVDADLSGCIFGLTLSTKPEEIYRALIEATAFGSKRIIETFEQYGCQIHEIYACGGLPVKNPFLMQIYADVLGISIKVASFAQTSALGAAMCGAVAAGAAQGGYDDIVAATKAMVPEPEIVYNPGQANKTYTKLYELYQQVHDYLGMGNILRTLKALK